MSVKNTKIFFHSHNIYREPNIRIYTYVHVHKFCPIQFTSTVTEFKRFYDFIILGYENASKLSSTHSFYTQQMLKLI